MPVLADGLGEEVAPPAFGVAEGGGFVESAFGPMVGRVGGDAVAAPAGAGDEEGDEGGAGDEAEDEGAGGEVPVVAGGEGEGGGGDVEEDAVTLDGDDLIFLQEGGEFDGEHVAGLIVVDDAPVGVHVVALGAGVGLAFLMAFGGADEVEFSLEAGGEEGGGEVVVAHVGGEDDGAGGDL